MAEGDGGGNPRPTPGASDWRGIRCCFRNQPSMMDFPKEIKMRYTQNRCRHSFGKTTHPSLVRYPSEVSIVVIKENATIQMHSSGRPSAVGSLLEPVMKAPGRPGAQRWEGVGGELRSTPESRGAAISSVAGRRKKKLHLVRRRFQQMHAPYNVQPPTCTLRVKN